MLKVTLEMRPLVIDERAKEQAKNILEYADAHWYRPWEEGPPGDNPNHVLKLFSGYRVVFSFTMAPKTHEVWRQLSISLTDSNRYPNPFAAYTIAQDLFGFTGWDGINEAMPAGWQMAMNRDEHTVVLVQRYK
jgi:hypothetical protein